MIDLGWKLKSDGGLKIRVEHVLTSWMRSTYRTIPDLKDHENSLLAISARR